jgi:uncharacterized protein YpmS
MMHRAGFVLATNRLVCIGERQRAPVNIWTFLWMVLLALGLSVVLWVMVQFALISDQTRDAIHGDDR